jgi:pyridoxal/pyridoxine/pyridoxamine kinase
MPFQGYVGDITFLNKLADIIDELKTKNPSLIYCKLSQPRNKSIKISQIILSCNNIAVCDPVLGDNNRWVMSTKPTKKYLINFFIIFFYSSFLKYVPKELLNIYKNRIFPKADILTPNSFELE